MPSTNQDNSMGTNYDVWERAFTEKGDIDVKPLLRGIHNKETALKAHRKIHEYDGSKKHKEYVAAKLRKYSD